MSLILRIFQFCDLDSHVSGTEEDLVLGLEVEWEGSKQCASSITLI